MHLGSWDFPRVGRVSQVGLICLNVICQLAMLISLIYWTVMLSGNMYVLRYGTLFLWKLCLAASLVSLTLVLGTCICCFAGFVVLFRRKTSYWAVLGSAGLFSCVLLGQLLRSLYFFALEFELDGVTPMLHYAVGQFLISIPLCIFIFGAEFAFRKRTVSPSTDNAISTDDSNAVPLIPKAYEDF